MFSFVLQLGSLATEKELKLRQAMTVMGVYDTPYWLSWLIWEGILTFVSSLFLVLFGMMFQLDFFLKNSFFVIFLLFLLFQINMISLAFMLSSFIRKSFSATTVGFLVFLIGFITQTVATEENLHMACGYIFFWFVLAIYFDNIIPNASGERKTIFYFLKPSYWTGKEGNKVEVPPIEHLTPDDQDVLEEETLVKKQAMDGTVVPNISVQIHGRAKMYPGTTKLGCCKCTKTSPFHAVKVINNSCCMNIAKDQLFCLLGPNGAWKKTTISCLTGINPVTGGDALIYGDSIRSSVGMSNIRKMIGVCPQVRSKHLHLFASIKGLPPASIKPIAEKLLADVKLTGTAKIRAGSYCGGMKRRLSVGIALIGDPKLVFLDEPTTGMDPITRRHVWDIIQESKKGRAIILTTHSMEEADILGDRIGIMAKGRLRCIGTSIRLKSRFGTGFITTVSFLENKNNGAGTSREPLKRFFKKHLKVEPIEEKKAFMTFVISHDKEKLLALQYRESEFGISNIQLGLATLEEVFLNIARWAELESATAEGTVVTLELESGILVEIPVGARFVGIPGTENAENPRGMMVEVYWQQDGSGLMCISGHSPEMRIPQNVSVLYEPPSQVLGVGSNEFGFRDGL
ncbi:BnaCnng43390D [Brassica napus]|uniref:BnaCnng43390D protein n=1 Tax=Brassica napus TaxID=3708 RepID=A0A078JG48_BRANA|nr:BnaCnng43390D [Brassica napus]